MRAAREIHAQRAETADEVLVQLDSIATRDTSALAQLERAGARLLASGSLTTPALQTYLKKQQGLVQQELATRRVLARLADATVFVVEWETTPRPVALESFRSLKTSGARIAGVIMQKVNVRKSTRYAYYDEAA